MEGYFIFILIATLVTIATEAWKKVYDEFVLLITGAKEWYDINIAIPLPLILAIFGAIALGQGIIGVYFGEYTNILLKVFDIFITGSIMSLGANAVYEIIDSIINKK